MNMKRYITILAACLFIAMTAGCSVKEDGIYGSFPYLEIEETAVKLSKVGQSHPIPYESNRNLKVAVSSMNGNWLQATASDGNIVLTFQDNPLETIRTATLTVTTPNAIITKEIKVTQEASGELTHDGDLILRSKGSINENTYTKTTGNLMVGDIAILKNSSTPDKLTTDFGDATISANPSDIDDSDMEKLTGQIHMVKEGGLVVIHTDVTKIPTELISNNDITRVYFVHNEMNTLPDAETMEALGLVELSLNGNSVSDISPLEDCSSITYLNLAGNDVHDLSPLFSMSGLKTVVLTGLPLSKPQYDVFLERFTNREVIAENLNTAKAVVPIINNIVVEELDENLVRLTAKIERNGGSSITKAGFYIGERREVDAMDFTEATVGADGTFTIDYQAETLLDRIYHVRAAATNQYGEGFSEASHFGSLIADEDIKLTSLEEIDEFYNSSYSHINGSLYVGYLKSNSNNAITLPGDKPMYFGKLELADLNKLRGIVYVRDGIYIGNTDVTTIDPIAHIEGYSTLWLKGNKITAIPELAAAGTLTKLDVSRNVLTSFTFLDYLPNIETLCLGDSNQPSKETNDIGILEGLETYTNIKHLDLSGLPLHQFQVDDLKELMPDCEIVFKTGGRTPHLPTVSSGSFKKGDQKATLSAYVVSAGKSDIIEHGFYFGKDVDNLEKKKVGDEISINSTFTLEVDIPDEDVYYFYPYAVNSLGETRITPVEFSLAYDDLCEFGTANCYIVTAEGKYRFDATVKGFSSEQIHPTAVSVLWETRHTYAPYVKGSIIQSIDLVGGQVEFTTTGQEGNALIAVKDDAGTILWSWHIWVTDMPETQDWVSQHGTFPVMDRNLGATRNDRGSGDEWREGSGTLYQLGRKDPFIYEGGFSVTSTTLSLDEIVKIPTTFIGAGNTWTSDTQIDLWKSDTKTMWDPCPPGYMVAKKEVFEHIAHGGWEWDFGRHLYYNNYNGGTYESWFPAVPLIDEWGNNSWRDGEGQIRTSGPDGWHNKYTLYINPDGAWYNEPSAGEGLAVRCMSMPDKFIVQTLAPTSSETSIMANGRLILNSDVNVDEKGFVLSDSDVVPTIGSNTAKVVAPDTSRGTFSCLFSELKSNTTYLVVAYAICNGETRYGEAVRVNTSSPGSGEGFTGDDFEW